MTKQILHWHNELFFGLTVGLFCPCIIIYTNESQILKKSPWTLFESKHAEGIASYCAEELLISSKTFAALLARSGDQGPLLNVQSSFCSPSTEALRGITLCLPLTAWQQLRSLNMLRALPISNHHDRSECLSRAPQPHQTDLEWSARHLVCSWSIPKICHEGT